MNDNQPNRYYIVQLKSGDQWLDVGAPFLDAYQAAMAARRADAMGYGVHRVEQRTDAKCKGGQVKNDF